MNPIIQYVLSYLLNSTNISGNIAKVPADCIFFAYKMQQIKHIFGAKLSFGLLAFYGLHSMWQIHFTLYIINSFLEFDAS